MTPWQVAGCERYPAEGLWQRLVLFGVGVFVKRSPSQFGLGHYDGHPHLCHVCGPGVEGQGGVLERRLVLSKIGHLRRSG